MAVMDVAVRDKFDRNGSIRAIADTAERFYRSGDFMNLFADSDRFMHVGFMMETTLATDAGWPWRFLRVVGYSVPDSVDGLFMGTAFPDMGRPRAVAIGWSDAGHFAGAEQDIRDFVITTQQ